MYRLNEEKVFADYVDDQMVALMIETGSYYTFSPAATAIIKDLASGYTAAAVREALRKVFGEAYDEAETNSLLQRVLEAGILEETEGEGKPLDDAMASLSGSLKDGGFVLEMEAYDDVASYFMIDPIHEVDPEVGWPYSKKDE